MEMEQILAELKEHTPSSTKCSLCGTPIDPQFSAHLEIIGSICPVCDKKLKTRSVYKCLFCSSAGFVDEDPLDMTAPEVMVTVSCPFCHDPMNRYPI